MTDSEKHFGMDFHRVPGSNDMLTEDEEWIIDVQGQLRMRYGPEKYSQGGCGYQSMNGYEVREGKDVMPPIPPMGFQGWYPTQERMNSEGEVVRKVDRGAQGTQWARVPDPVAERQAMLDQIDYQHRPQYPVAAPSEIKLFQGDTRLARRVGVTPPEEVPSSFVNLGARPITSEEASQIKEAFLKSDVTMPTPQPWPEGYSFAGDVAVEFGHLTKDEWDAKFDPTPATRTGFWADPSGGKAQLDADAQNQDRRIDYAVCFLAGVLVMLGIDLLFVFFYQVGAL